LAESLVASIVLLSVISPSKLSGELELFGHRVWEALDVSEVLFLCEQHRVDAVIIAAEVEGGEIIEKQLRGTVMRLKSNADAAYVDWELSQLFPKKDARIQ
jgi:AmiR/NasT family two-component response regulator